ncbi:MAG: histidine kinase dimerization/phosphoacceptor domain -containing protein [Brevinematales bacterium]
MKKARIGICINNKEDHTLLINFLNKKFEIIPLQNAKEFNNSFDLIIIDGIKLRENEKEIINFKKNLSFFIPFLLVTTNEFASMLSNNLNKLVDELIFLPISKIELSIKIEVLLKSHNYSLKLWEELSKKHKEKENTLFLISKEFNIDYINYDLTKNRISSSYEMKKEIILNNFTDLKNIIHPEDWPKFELLINRLTKEKEKIEDIHLRIKENESYRWKNMKLYLEKENHSIELKMLIIDIENLVSSREELKVALREKEILLRELFHRTKNNMQIISSLMTLSSAKLEDDRVKNMCKDVQSKIQSMALVHEKLCHGKSLSSIEITSYIKELSSIFLSLYQKNIAIEVNKTQDIEIDIDKATTIGLVISELLTNSFKYAFKDNESGKITLTISSNKDNLTIEYIDNGCFDQNYEVFLEKKTLGGFLITTLVREQLKGLLKFVKNKGFHCIIQVPST